MDDKMTGNFTTLPSTESEEKNSNQPTRRLPTFENEFGIPVEISQHKLSLSPTLSSRFKRKGNFSPIDLSDNYHAQKRHISEAMAIQMGMLSLDSAASSNRGNFFPSPTFPHNFLHINEIPRSSHSRPSIEALNARLNAPSFTVNSVQPFVFTPPASPTKKEFSSNLEGSKANFNSSNEDTNNKTKTFNGLRKSASKVASTQPQNISNNYDNENNNAKKEVSVEDRIRDFRKMRSKSLSSGLRSSLFSDPFPELRSIQNEHNKALVLYKTPSDVIFGGLQRNNTKPNNDNGMEIETVESKKESYNNQMSI